MSGSQSQQGAAPSADPSMEDILASIRRILSEEDAPAAEAPANDTAAPVAEQPQDVLILDNSMLVADAPPRAPVARVPPPVLVRTPEPVAAPVVMPEPPPVVEEPVMHELAAAPVLMPVPPAEEIESYQTPQPESPDMSASLASSNIASVETTAAAAGSVSNLVRALTSDRAAQVSSGGPTIADLVREEIRPILKSWLDNNLPPMVERLVRAEIDRVVARATL